MAYEVAIKELAAYIRSELSPIEEISSISFEIDISGRLHDGELKIAFTLGQMYGACGQVKGGSIDAVIKEYKRRFGWEQRNQPLELSFAPEPQAETVTTEVN